MTKADKPKPTPIEATVDQLLTEARVIIPGAQALLGFQLSVTLMRAFQELAESTKIIHIAALCGIAFTIILLMAPASLHRISFAVSEILIFGALAGSLRLEVIAISSSPSI